MVCVYHLEARRGLEWPRSREKDSELASGSPPKFQPFDTCCQRQWALRERFGIVRELSGDSWQVSAVSCHTVAGFLGYWRFFVCKAAPPLFDAINTRAGRMECRSPAPPCLSNTCTGYLNTLSAFVESYASELGHRFRGHVTGPGIEFRHCLPLGPHSRFSAPAQWVSCVNSLENSLTASVGSSSAARTLVKPCRSVQF